MNDPNWSPHENDDLDDRRIAMDSVSSGGGGGPPSLGPYEMYSLPYDKRADHGGKSMMYDRRSGDMKSAYEKRKYARERDYPLPPPSRLPYDLRSDYDPYSQEAKERRAYYEDKYERRRQPDYPDEVFDRDFDRGSRDSCNAAGSYTTKRDYFYERGGVDKRSFDRESMDSYESAGNRGRRSFGSDELFNSLDNRGGEFRGDDKKKSYRKNLRSRPSDEYDQDSEGEIKKFAPGETRSLQRPSSSGIRPSKSSGSSPWDCEGKLVESGFNLILLHVAFPCRIITASWVHEIMEGPWS